MVRGAGGDACACAAKESGASPLLLLEPGVVGLLQPVLLLPSGIAERLTPLQLEAVLAHELCHVRRRDNLTAAVHMVVEAVFWFHPLVWWVGAKLVEERERACDEEVLRLGSEPRAYAEGILNVCKLYTESPLRCVSGVTGSDLKKRIEAIMTNRMAIRLNLARKVALAAAGVAVVSAPIVIGMMHAPPGRAQPTPKFEVATVRPCKPGESAGPIGTKSKSGGGPAQSISPGRLSTGCLPLADSNSLGLIQRAYVRFAGGNTNPFRIVAIQGGPEWVRTEQFTITAKADGEPSPQLMQGPMLQALLEERFKLKIRRESREAPVYELTAGKDISKLKRFIEGSCTPAPFTFPRPALEPGQKHCSMLIVGRRPTLKMEGGTLDDLSKMLSRILDRPVIDKTGISAKFDIEIDFALDQATPGLSFGDAPPPADPDRPSIFTVIKELGLKLEPAKGPQEFLVIDHVERRSGN
jgi:bla regulator protein BlaR1